MRVCSHLLILKNVLALCCLGMSEFSFIQGQSLLKRSFVLQVFSLALFSGRLFCRLNYTVVFNSGGKSCLFIQVCERGGVLMGKGW